MKFINTILLILLVLLQHRVWTGHGSVPEVRDLKARLKAQVEENNKLEERNHTLGAEVLDLKQGLEAIEERARSEMGMIKKDETFFRIITRANSIN